MTKTKFTEDSYEQALISLFRDELGYDYIYGPDIERDYRQPCYVDALEPAIRRLNPSLPDEVIEEAEEQVEEPAAEVIAPEAPVEEIVVEEGTPVAEETDFAE